MWFLFISFPLSLPFCSFALTTSHQGVITFSSTKLTLLLYRGYNCGKNDLVQDSISPSCVTLLTPRRLVPRFRHQLSSLRSVFKCNAIAGAAASAGMSFDCHGADDGAVVHKSYESQQNMVLPIFPLRKSIRFPTDTLTLNLHEERYLRLAEWVLYSRGKGKDIGGVPTDHSVHVTDASEQEVITDADEDGNQTEQQQLFGALYCSSKTQIVRGGIDPITPMIDRGDVGVVCRVMKSSDRYYNDGRRKIHIQGLAVGRFCVERILHDGYGGVSSSSLFTSDEGHNGNGADPLPFIVVEARSVNDVRPLRGTEEESDLMEMEQRLINLMNERHSGMEGFIEPSESVSGLQGSESWCVSLAEKKSLFAWDCQDNKNVVNREAGEQKSHYSWRAAELISFVAVSALFSSGAVRGSASEMELVLRTNSTKRRMEYVLEYYDNNRGWRF